MIIVNAAAVYRGSLGIRRYYENVRNASRWNDSVVLTKLTRFGSWDRFAELTARGHRDSIYWSPGQRGPLWAHNHVVTFHDCINVKYVHVNDWRLGALRWASQKLIDNAVAVVAISDATRTAVLNAYAVDDSKITVIRSSCDVNLPHQLDQEISPISNVPFVLMVTNKLPHKNTERACQAFVNAQLSRNGVVLRIVGNISAAAREICYRGKLKVEFSEGISDATLVRLYRSCLFFVSASLDEGHDLPIAEALSQHTRVLCSDIPAHREFYQGAVEFFDPKDVDSISAVVERALRQPKIPAMTQLPARSFKDVARDYEQLFDNIMR